MTKKKKPEIIRRRVAFAKMWREERLCFAFHGVTREEVSEALRGMSNLHGECRMTVEKPTHILNGRCHETVIATISEPRTDMLSEKEWPMMIERFLVKVMPCQVTYFEDFDRFLNT